MVRQSRRSVEGGNRNEDALLVDFHRTSTIQLQESIFFRQSGVQRVGIDRSDDWNGATVDDNVGGGGATSIAFSQAKAHANPFRLCA